jgi:hypothetical protein
MNENPINEIHDYVNELEQQNVALLAALKEMLNPPTILDHDHPYEIASWFVEKTKQAIADAEAERKSPLHPCDVELPEGSE